MREMQLFIIWSQKWGRGSSFKIPVSILCRFFFFFNIFEKKEGEFGASPLLPHPKAAGLHNENTVPEYRA